MQGKGGRAVCPVHFLLKRCEKSAAFRKTTLLYKNKIKIPGGYPAIPGSALSAVYVDGLTDELGGSVAVAVDVILETFIKHIHLAQTGKDFFGAGVAGCGDVILKLFHKGLIRLRSLKRVWIIK